MLVGLTGGIGSGKTTISNFFKAKANVQVYTADDRAKYLMHHDNDVKKKLIEVFGKETYNREGLNRKHLAKLVFNNAQKLKKINEIVHPAVAQDFEAFKYEHQEKIIIYEAAILFETNAAHRFDFIISVTAPLEERIRRVAQRDGSSRDEVMQRIKNQFSDPQRILQSHYVISNDSIEKAKLQFQKIYNILTKKREQI